MSNTVSSEISRQKVQFPTVLIFVVVFFFVFCFFVCSFVVVVVFRGAFSVAVVVLFKEEAGINECHRVDTRVMIIIGLGNATMTTTTTRKVKDFSLWGLLSLLYQDEQ